jgi:hypothetical protein
MLSSSKVKTIYAVFLSIVCLLSFNPIVEAACGGANCSLLTGSQDGVLGKDRFVMDLSYRYVLSENPHRGSDSTNQALVPKVNFETRALELGHHNEIRTINKLAQFDISYGVTDKLTLSMNMPFFNDRYHEHFDGIENVGDTGTFNNTDGTTGFGDVTLIAKYALWQTTKHMFVGGVGIKFATGDYKLKDTSGSINEPTLMPGTGSYDAILSGIYNYSAIPNKLNIFTSVSHRFATENDLDYQFGDTTLIDAGVGYVLTKKVSVSGQVNMRISGRDQFIDANVPSTGGEFIFITPGVRLAVYDDVSIYSHVQLPIYQRVNDVNLVEDYGVMLGASYNF